MTTKEKIVKIDLDIGDQLTSISCGHIIVEIVKFIAYQRLQIPYTYQWLKQIVNKRKLLDDKRDGYQSERHFHVASTALDNLDFILKQIRSMVSLGECTAQFFILNEFILKAGGNRCFVYLTLCNTDNTTKSILKEVDGATLPEEICIALGGTPITCKEIYRFLLPSACHKPQCHSNLIASDQKIQRSVFKNLVTSEKLSQVFNQTIPPTNMYLFLKKNMTTTQDIVCGDSFVFINGYKVPKSCKVIVIDFRTQKSENIFCCNQFQIFGDIIAKSLDDLKMECSDVENEFNEIESSDEVKWFQSSYIMKGFKDCIVNGSSITNTWLEP